MSDAKANRRRPSSKGVRLLALIAVVFSLIVGVGSSAVAKPDDPPGPKPTIVIEHGAFTDASGWSKVIDRLQDRGFTVIAPANPLRNLDSDSAYLSSILDTIEGPVVLVGHSYGGMVISNAANGHPNVKALVFIAAFAPDTGETVGGLGALNPGGGVTPDTLVIRPYPNGVDGYIKAENFRDIFAADVPRDQAAVMAASQRPFDLAIPGQPAGPPAWKTIPSWYLVAAEDHAIPPATERFMAQRAGSTTVEVRSSHVAMISHPREVTNLILDASRSVH